MPDDGAPDGPTAASEHRRGRRVVRPEDLSEADLELIARSEVPAEYAHLDADPGSRGRPSLPPEDEAAGEKPGGGHESPRP